ncbi:MAG TPA: phosphoribosylaminoimidazolesuccinocarboxamide synthase [Longimicrobium sp.]
MIHPPRVRHNRNGCGERRCGPVRSSCSQEQTTAGRVRISRARSAPRSLPQSVLGEGQALTGRDAVAPASARERACGGRATVGCFSPHHLRNSPTLGCRAPSRLLPFRLPRPGQTQHRSPLLTPTLVSTDLPFPLRVRGKVRDVYDLGDALLMVATDRVSAFDVVMPQPVPRKGEVLTLISAWWFARTADLVPNHLLSVDPDDIAARHPALQPLRELWARRSMLVRKLQPFPVECVVRGYLSGSAWKEYREHGTLAGEPLPAGLAESGRLDPPVFSPATKAETGHDENIPFGRMEEILGAEVAGRLREHSLALYGRGRSVAAGAGIIIADTKFEFGRDGDGTIRVMDEVMTPDSSRFWPGESYAPGRGQPSLDKQPLRDWLEERVGRGEWNKAYPAPDLPPAVVEATSARYQDAFRRLTGMTLDEFPLGGGEEGG